jgi:iron complex outermembrane receptor protein
MKPRYCVTLFAAFAAVLSLSAQEAKEESPQTAADAAAKGEAVQLPAFTINAETDTGYVGKSALSSTRIAVDIADLPQSVKVLNSSFVKAVNPFNLSDVLNYTGGSQSGSLNWTPGRLAIRGFSGDGDYNDSFAPPAASVVDSSIYDRFEVIKGPSTIFLAADGSPGGLVNKITKSPLSKQQTTLSVQAGMFDGNRVSIDSSGPLTSDSKLLYRVVGAMQYSEGYYDSTNIHRFTLMPSLSYQFSPDTKVELKYLLVETNFPSYNGLQMDPRTLQIWDVPYTRSSSEDSPYNWRHDAVDRLWVNFTSRLNDHVALRIAAMNAYDRADRLESLANTWNDGGRAWNAATSPTTYTGGAYPRTTTADDATTRYRDIQSDLNFNFKTGPANHSLLVGSELRDQPSGQINYAGTSSPWNPFVRDPNPIVTVNYSAKSAWTQSTSTLARVYVLETLKLFSDRLLLSYGVTRTRATGSTTNGLTGVVTTPEYVVFKNLKQYGAVYKIMDGLNAFYGYNENYALNGVGTVNGVVGTPLAPKQGKQSEVGLKTVFFDKKVSLNVSYFDVQQKNNTVPSSPQDPLNPNILIPGVISRGFDGDLSYQVTKSFYLMGSFSLFKAKSILGPAGATFVQPFTKAISVGSIPVNNISQNSASLLGLYQFTSGNLKGLNLGLGGNYLTKRAVTDNANQVWFGYIPARTILNANASYRWNKHINYSLNVDNLLDKKYIYSSRSVNVLVPGQGLNLKLSVEYSF